MSGVLSEVDATHWALVLGREQLESCHLSALYPEADVKDRRLRASRQWMVSQQMAAMFQRETIRLWGVR